ncbi:peptidoglycan-binding protein [Szabonella alba]|uniref:Peptidoglycan-binding protein n=1 Tax=Szabonella alba TaxID=2804194 RepID=A0A8K0V8E0_9RHOB|nr:peptidoglycan-binding protein [Szabonella alba]MBL4916176.1 peptidoglycan-binding protein [Szabonella alba]
MLPMFRTTIAAAIAGLALIATPVAPAHALGKNERNFLKGAAAAAIVGAIILDQRKRQARAATPQQVVPHYNPPPRYQDHGQPRYRDHDRPRAQDYGPRRGRVVGAEPPVSSGLYQTASARAFNSYSPARRQAIQRRLAAYGYYGGAIDGAFGPRTHEAIYAFARQSGRTGGLESLAGAHALMEALLV